MAAVTICSDFGAQENKICHCFHWFPLFPHLFAEVMGLDAKRGINEKKNQMQNEINLQGDDRHDFFLRNEVGYNSKV